MQSLGAFLRSRCASMPICLHRCCSTSGALSSAGNDRPQVAQSISGRVFTLGTYVARIMCPLPLPVALPGTCGRAEHLPVGQPADHEGRPALDASRVLARLPLALAGPLGRAGERSVLWPRRDVARPADHALALPAHSAKLVAGDGTMRDLGEYRL